MKPAGKSLVDQVRARLRRLGFGRAPGIALPAFAIPAARPTRRQGGAPRVLGVLLCHNDADMLPDAIEALLENKHDLVVWDHGSDDETGHVLDRYVGHLRERRFVPRSFDFYQLYEAMSEHLIRHYCADYDWISWPDQDEILEGPARDRSYYNYLMEVMDSEFNWIQFRNFNFWFTTEDDPTVLSPTKRILRYCLFPDCSARIRAWRASVTNIRHFNHNPLKGPKYPRDFNLRHYPMRSERQMLKRLSQDRANLQRGGENYHYNHMKKDLACLRILPDQLHLDDSKTDLNTAPIFNWGSIYGPPGNPAAVTSEKTVLTAPIVRE